MAQEFDSLPAELRAFLHSCIESIDQVELLVLMRGSERWRSTRDAADELRLPVAVARRDLDTLAARGLLEVSVGQSETTYRYAPKTPELARYADLLAQHYVTSRNLVFRAVASDTRLAIRRFADAFRFGKKEE